MAVMAVMAVMALVSGRGPGDIGDAVGARGAHGAQRGAAPSRCPLGAVPPGRRRRAERHQLLRGIESKISKGSLISFDQKNQKSGEPTWINMVVSHPHIT